MYWDAIDLREDFVRPWFLSYVTYRTYGERPRAESHGGQSRARDGHRSQCCKGPEYTTVRRAKSAHCTPNTLQEVRQLPVSAFVRLVDRDPPRFGF